MNAGEKEISLIDPNLAMNFAMTAGEAMLRFGAETNRVEDTMMRLLVNCGFETAESFVTTTGIFASIQSEHTGIVTMIKRVKNRTIDFEKVADINSLSRNFAERNISFAQGCLMLQDILKKPSMPVGITILASGVGCFAFAKMFGGVWADCFNALFTGLAMQFFVQLMLKNRVSNFLVNLVGGGLLSFFALVLLNLGLGKSLDNVIIGAIMPLVPGISITNAIRDVLEGDFLSGTTRTVDALIVAVAIATGVGTVLKLWFFAFGGVLI